MTTARTIPAGPLELLRPRSDRGELLAAGAVLLTLAVLLLQVRMDEEWGSGVHFVVNLLAAAVV